MAKYGELWDDSALVFALDDAISKYKIMHVKGGHNDSLKEERITKGTEESEPILNGSNEAKSANVETDDKTTDVTKNMTHPRDATNSSVAEKCSSEVIEQFSTPSNGVQVNAESAEAYKLLLDQYNAVEEQRQKLLAQFSQYGNWDYQGYGYDYGASYDSQYHSLAAPEPSGPPVCSCRPYVCPYSTAPCTSLAAGSSVPLEDGGFIKAAMGAVDQAVHSFNTQTSGIPEVDKEGSTNVAQDGTSQTDLSVVLNAWFSAGFYTGKYLSEQRKPFKGNDTYSSFKDISEGK